MSNPAIRSSYRDAGMVTEHCVYKVTQSDISVASLGRLRRWRLLPVRRMQRTAQSPHIAPIVT